MIIQLKKTFSNVSTFADFSPLVRKAKENISFFGQRYISVEGYKGSVEIDTFARKAMEIVKKNYEFSEEERSIGKEVSPLIDKLYEDNDKRKRNILTRIFCAIRDFIKGIFEVLRNSKGIRFQWEIGSEGSFYKYYTINQYKTIFGSEPKTWPCTSNPKRWEAPELVS